MSSCKFQKVKDKNVVVDSPREGVFVEVLNQRKYIKDGKEVNIPIPLKPQKITVEHDHYVEEVERLKSATELSKKVEVTCEDLSTEEAIAIENGHEKIALNFANEHHAGGGPGIHLDSKSGKLVYDGPSARAQEESLVQHSDLMASLTQLKHTLRRDSPTSYMIRSYFDEPFDSKNMAYVSQNHLFAVKEEGKRKTFYDSVYLDKPVPVSFITSAAPILTKETVKKGDLLYQDVRQRILTHLIAATTEAVRIKADSDKPVELMRKVIISQNIWFQLRCTFLFE